MPPGVNRMKYLGPAILAALALTTSATAVIHAPEPEPCPPTAPTARLAQVDPLPEPRGGDALPPPPPPPPLDPPPYGLVFYDGATSRLFPGGGVVLGPKLTGPLRIGYTTVNECLAAKGLWANTLACVLYGSWNGCSINAGCEVVSVALLGIPIGPDDAVRWSVTQPGGHTYYVKNGEALRGAWVAIFGVHPIEIWGNGVHTFRADIFRADGSVEVVTAGLEVQQGA